MIDRIIDWQSIPNPFSSYVVADPERQLSGDVPGIHKQAFDLCRAAYERVIAESASQSVLLYGEAGCGKTHLLSRFLRWVSGEMEFSPSTPPALFVAVRMETAPGQIWRHLRRRFVEELTRRNPDGRSPLDHILRQFASKYQGSLSAALDSVSIQGLGLDLSRVLEHFADGNQRRLCRAWLAGEGLSDTDLQTLNLSQSPLDEIEEDDAEASASRVVEAIIRLCSPSPVVFCFDQVEALGISQQTKNYALFSRMGASLVDGTSNSLVISTVLATYLANLENSSMVSDFQRISKDRADLQPLDWELTKALVQKRIELVPELAHENPIAESSLRVFFDAQHGRCNPRRLIWEARRLFTQWQGKTEPPPVPLDDFLRGQFESMWAEAQLKTAKTENTDAVLAQGLPVALHLLGETAEQRAAGLTVGAGASRIHVEFANQTGNSLTNRLKKLVSNPPSNATLCVIRDLRLPVTETARVARQCLEQIEKNGGRVVRVDAEALAVLDAMQHMISLATSGDLSHSGDSLDVGKVREWLARNLPPAVVRFAAEILNERPYAPNDSHVDALLKLVGKLKVVSVDDAARATAWPKEQIENYARAHPHHLGLFGGSCPVVCQALAPPASGRAPSDRVSGRESWREADGVR
jgi:hypothetical protein